MIAIARGVGLVVAIVAVLLWFMLMMVLRALLAFCLNKFGVSGIALLIVSLIYGAMKYRNMSGKVIWSTLRNSCS